MYVCVAQSGLDGQGPNPGGNEIFPRPEQPWGPLRLLYNGYRVFPGEKFLQGVLLTTHPLLVLRSRKSSVIPLPTLSATPVL